MKKLYLLSTILLSACQSPTQVSLSNVRTVCANPIAYNSRQWERSTGLKVYASDSASTVVLKRNPDDGWREVYRVDSEGYCTVSSR